MKKNIEQETSIIYINYDNAEGTDEENSIHDNNNTPTLLRVTRGGFLFIDFIDFFFSGYNKEKC